MSAQAQSRTTEATGIAGAQGPALIGGIIFLVITVIGWVMNPVAFYRAYLPSYLFWFEIVAGALGILMIQYVTGGEWGLMIRRPLGAAARTMPVMLFFFIPVVVGMRYIYPWANPELVAHDHVLHLKQSYLNREFWLIRGAIYFAA